MSRLQLFKNNPTALFIYGTGTFSRDVLDAITQHGLKVSGFLDHNPRQPVVRGSAVTKPNALSPEMRDSSSVIIGIHNRDANIAAIISRLNSLGYTHIITPIDLYDHFEKELGTRYWLTGRAFYQKFESQIQAVNNLWVDDFSRDIYTRTLQFRATGDYSLLPKPDWENQYFPLDLPLWKQPVRFVDCGAYNGDVIQSLSDHNYRISAVAAFEPDLDNFQTLTNYVLESEIQNTILWPCGVYSSTTQLKFSTGQGEASAILDDGTTVVQCVSLDNVIPDFKPTLIKMDIEGAEIEALQGAQNILHKYKPGLAISVYHSPEHIWEIPLLIEKISPNTYQYYLRSHAYNDFDTVFYAIPI